MDRFIIGPNTYAARLKFEKQLIQEWRIRAEKHLGEIEKRTACKADANDRIGTMTVMQHYGAPTRLLDWSQSAFVAAYFAVIDDEDCDGAVWWFDWNQFHPAANREWRKLGMVPKKSQEFDYHPFAFNECSKSFIGPVALKLPFARAEAQQGLFTFSGRHLECHDDLLQRLLCDSNHNRAFGKIIIPASIKHDMIAYLAKLNITSRSLRCTGADRCGSQLAKQIRSSLVYSPSRGKD